MPNYRFQVVFENESGLPEDRFINVLHAVCADDTAAMSFAADLSTGYGTVLTGQTNGLTEYYSSAVQRPGAVHEIRVYDLADPEPRVPVGTTPFGALTANVSDALPNEVALVLSFQATPVSGGVQARRRGRIYLGPFNSSALGGAGGTSDSRPSGTMVDDVIIFAEYLLALTTGEWSVKSTFSAVMVPVADGWVDNAWDTQRRRGAAPTVRTTFS